MVKAGPSFRINQWKPATRVTGNVLCNKELTISDVFRISAKKLGELAMPDFCPRCFWIRQHMDGDPPFFIFPRIFNDIDNFTKRVVQGWFDEKGKAPPWLDPDE